MSQEMVDMELDEIQARLGTPASAIEGQVARRRFLQGALAIGAGALVAPTWADHLASAATPIGSSDGVLVVVQLGGGNDGLSLLSPLSGHADHGRYQSARGVIAVSGARPLSDDLGLHPSLPRLKARWDQGQVAAIGGVGRDGEDLSHFTSMAAWMAGSASASRSTGWLGRWLDGVPESDAGLRGVHMGSSIPLHLTGTSSKVTALGSDGDLFGADRSEAWRNSLYDGVIDMGEGTTGRGRLADLVADSGVSAVESAQRIAPVYDPALPDDGLVRDLTLAARLVNADLGVRVVSCGQSGYDLHHKLSATYPMILDELDRAIEAFFATLAPRFRDRVALMTFSEFGRRVNVNASGGTDHGTASPQLLIGSNVKGGMFGAQPRLDDLDANGNLKLEVDLRSYYASIIDGWLAGGSSTILGGNYEDLGLFRSSPGGPSTPPPPVDGAWRPFRDPATLVRQQYLDFLGRPADSTGVAYWVGKLTSGSSISWVVNAFLASPEFGAAVAPAARLALACLGEPFGYADLLTWAGRVRRGDTVAEVAADVVTRSQFAARYGILSDRAFVERAHRDATGSPPSSSWADVMAEIVGLPGAVAHLRVQVEVMMTYAGLLRRAPDPPGYVFWVGKGNAGASIQRLVAMFFASDEYRRRFE